MPVGPSETMANMASVPVSVGASENIANMPSETRIPFICTLPPDKLSDPNPTPLTTYPEMKYLARSTCCN